MNPQAKRLRRLVVNVEGRRVDIGIPGSERWEAIESVEGNPVENLAPTLRTLLDRSGLHPGDFDAWIYSGGPGSLLGLRSLAMLLATWEVSLRPKTVAQFRFSGMVWAARDIQRKHPGEPFSLISPWRTNAWNVLTVSNLPAEEKNLQVSEGSLHTDLGKCYFLRGERMRSNPPPEATSVQLPSFETLIHHLDSPGFLTETAKVEPILSGTTQYKKWIPRAG